MKKLTVFFLTLMVAAIPRLHAQQIVPFLKKDGLYIYVDSAKTPAPVVGEFDKASLFSEGLAAVRLGDKWGYINSKGERISSFSYSEAENLTNGVAFAYTDRTPVLIDSNGKRIVTLNYDHIQTISEDIAVVALNNKWGFYHTKERTEKVFCRYKGIQ